MEQSILHSDRQRAVEQSQRLVRISDRQKPVFDEKCVLGRLGLCGIFVSMHICQCADNHIPALALILLAVWLLLCAPFRHQTVNVVIAGAALACSELLRPETILILVSFIVWQGFVFLKSKGKGMIMVLGSVLLLLGSYAGVLQLGDAAARVSGIAPQGVKSEDLYYKFLVGLNPHTMGRFSASLIRSSKSCRKQA